MSTACSLACMGGARNGARWEEVMEDALTHQVDWGEGRKVGGCHRHSTEPQNAGIISPLLRCTRLLLSSDICASCGERATWGVPQSSCQETSWDHMVHFSTLELPWHQLTFRQDITQTTKTRHNTVDTQLTQHSDSEKSFLVFAVFSMHEYQPKDNEFHPNSNDFFPHITTFHEHPTNSVGWLLVNIGWVIPSIVILETSWHYAIHAIACGSYLLAM